MDMMPQSRKQFEQMRTEFFASRPASQPIMPAFSKKLVDSYWARQWCLALNSYALYGHSLAAGRTLLRKHCVCDLEVIRHELPATEPPQGEHEVTATVWAGEAYEASVCFAPLGESKEACQQRIAGSLSLPELLAGELPDDLADSLADQATGLIPNFGELSFSCTCPDHAELCPHVAALLYAIAVRLDQEPHLLFTLRDVTAAELIDGGLSSASGACSSSKTDAETDAGVEDLFDLEFDVDGEES